jgi:hypothetical protein
MLNGCAKLAESLRICRTGVIAGKAGLAIRGRYDVISSPI